jgi:hypothetical protein
MKTRTHTHPCAHCQTPVECDGALEQNHDGWPPVMCTVYHLPSGMTLTALCEDCAAQNGDAA